MPATLCAEMRAEHLVRRHEGSLIIEVVNEPTYVFGSHEDRSHYRREEVLGDAKFQLTSRHGVVSTLRGECLASAIFGAAGGASGVHQHSLALVNDRGFLAVGPFVVCIELPTLTTDWVREVDEATCLGVHICPDGHSLISHGELEISQLSVAGDILWQAGGRDIFTGSLSVNASAVLAEDFNGDLYSFDLQTGDSVARHDPTSR